ncbi:MAG: hypothetical protein AAFU57_15945 [Bacteroidota bacterium]
MDLFTHKIPFWISLLFLFAMFIPINLVASAARRGVERAELPVKSINMYGGIALFYALYLLYVTIACYQGLFSEVTLPPKIMLFTAFPLLLFLGGVVFNLPITKQILAATPIENLVIIHLFRLIGTFFLILGDYALVPPLFSIFAGFGDIAIALTSIGVYRMNLLKLPNAKTYTWLWNTAGLFDILLTSFMAFWYTKKSIDEGGIGVEILTEFPFCFIPAFAPATIIFLHLCIYRKLLESK